MWEWKKKVKGNGGHNWANWYSNEIKKLRDDNCTAWKIRDFPFWNKNITKVNPKNGRKQEGKEIEEEGGDEKK